MHGCVDESTQSVCIVYNCHLNLHSVDSMMSSLLFAAVIYAPPSCVHVCIIIFAARLLSMYLATIIILAGLHFYGMLMSHINIIPVDNMSSLL